MRNKAALLAFAVLTVTCGGCQKTSSSAKEPSTQVGTSSQQSPLRLYDDPDAYAVYKVLLGSPELPGGEVPNWTVAIESQTTGDKLCFDPAAKTDSRLREAAIDYDMQNSKPRLLGADRLEFGRKVELISLAELDSIFSAGIIPGWKRFHEEHSEVHGYYGLSAVGFSADRSFAVVVTGGHCGPSCGAGGAVTLSKRNGVWHKNSDQLCSWIS